MGTKAIASATSSAPPVGEVERDFTIGGNGGGDSGSGNGHLISALPRSPNPTSAETGVWVALAAISMCFASLISAMIVRQGASPDWLHFQLPRILYLNTLVLLVSSATLEVSRHWFASGSDNAWQESLDAEARIRALAWLYATAALGLLFILGQVMAWRVLNDEGVFLATSPSSSFFYVLTALHGLHLLGGAVGLGYVLYRLTQSANPHHRRVLRVASVYWHFMDGLWVFLLVVLAARA